MSDVEKILYLLMAFTVVYGAVWIRPGTVLFVSNLGERHRPRWLAGRSLIRNDRGGLLWSNLVPLGSSFATGPWPLAISPTGVLAYSSTAPTPDDRPDDSGEFMAFADLRSVVCDEKKLLLDGKLFFTLSSKMAARRWAKWLTEVKDISEADRERWIENALAESCDSEAAARRIGECRRSTRWLRLAANALFLYCFLILGLQAAEISDIAMGDGLFGYAILAALTFLLHGRAKKRLISADNSAGGHGWMMLVFPVDAFRAADQLFRQPLEIYHPLAVRHALTGGLVDDEFARRIVRDLQFPLPRPEPFPDPRAEETARWFADKMRRAIGRIVGDANADRYLVPPQPDDPLSIAFCPRCEGQFVRAPGVCTACGVALQPFEGRLFDL